MKKDIPEIDDLIAGINDPDVALGAIPQTTVEAPSLVMAPAEEPLHETCSDKCWQDFLSLLDVEEPATDKSGRLVCKLDRDLADSLDDCDICNRSRSDLVNAIVRAFFTTYLAKLAKYRREKKSLFTNFKEESYDGKD